MKNVHLHIAVRLSKWLKYYDIATALENNTLVMASQCGRFKTSLNVSELAIAGTDRQLQHDLIYYHSRRLLRVFKRQISYINDSEE